MFPKQQALELNWSHIRQTITINADTKLHLRDGKDVCYTVIGRAADSDIQHPVYHTAVCCVVDPNVEPHQSLVVVAQNPSKVSVKQLNCVVWHGVPKMWYC